MSALPAPGDAPRQPSIRPEAVPHRPKKSRGLRQSRVLIALLLLVAGGLALWLLRTRPKATSGGGPGGPSAIRTALIVPGPVERTLRLTGVTAAANYASLITPRLIGSRGGFGRDAGGGGGGGGSSPASGSSSIGSSSGS